MHRLTFRILGLIGSASLMGVPLLDGNASDRQLRHSGRAPAISDGLSVVSAPLPLSAPASVSSAAAAPAVRPGAKVIFGDNRHCTMNFVFEGSDRRTYIGTAGHCPLYNAEGVKTWKKGAGIEALDGSGARIGEFAFAALFQREHIDFALIRLDRGVEANPEMIFFGGPAAMNDETSTDVALLNLYGHGQGISDVKPDRQLLAPGGLEQDKAVFVNGVVAPGDSGSPVTTDDDEAVGVASAIQGVVRIPGPGEGIPYAGNAVVVRLPHNLALAEDTMKLRLKLRTVDS